MMSHRPRGPSVRKRDGTNGAVNVSGCTFSGSGAVGVMVHGSVSLYHCSHGLQDDETSHQRMKEAAMSLGTKTSITKFWKGKFGKQ